MLFVEKVLAGSASDIIGSISNPVKSYGNVTESTGFVAFFSNVLRLVFVVAGIYAFINLIIAGFQYMTAGGDSKAMNAAWSRIWQSLLGLIIIVGSFALAALIGAVVFGDAGFILRPKIYGPQ